MTDCDSLLAAIRAESADDTPRLIFADWLDEHGEHAGEPWSIAPSIRAAFIRAQVEHARAEPHSPEARAAAARAATILKPLKGHWSRHLQRLILGSEFARGFIERVNVDAAILPSIAESLFDTEPIQALQVTRFRTSAGRVSLEPVFELPQLKGVEELDLSAQELTNTELTALFRSEPLAKLRRLAIRKSTASFNTLLKCLSGEKLAHLTELDLRHNPQFQGELTKLWPRCAHRRFTALDLSHLPLRYGDIGVALNADCTSQIEVLHFAAPPNRVADGEDVAAVIAESPNLQHLRVLDLSGVMIGEEGAVKLARSRGLSQLRVLNLMGNGLSTRTVNAFLKDSAWDLFELNLKFNAMGFAELDALKHRFPQAVIEG